MKLHPQDLTLQELVEALGGSNRALFQHILFCPSCLARARSLFQVPAISAPSSGNVVAIDRWVASSRPARTGWSQEIERLQTSFEMERSQASQLVADLMAEPAERRRLVALNQARFQTWAFCEQLLNHSRELNYSNVAQGEELAELATLLTERLDPQRYGQERVEDLRARAWSHLGNSRRILSDLAGAEAAFERAMVHLKDGTGEPMERAVILDLRASLFRPQRRFEEALRSLRRAIASFRELGETHRAGRALLSMALIHQMEGNPGAAIPLVYECLELIEPEREPRLIFSAWFTLISNLTELGRFLEAHKLATQSRQVLNQYSEPWAVNPRLWVEGRIARGLGQKEQAEKLFRSAQERFLAEGSPYEVALVALDLAALCLEQGRFDEARKVTAEALPVFTSRNVQREALGAFVYWQQAVNAGTAHAELATSVAQFLKRARHDPALRFEPPAGSNK